MERPKGTKDYFGNEKKVRDFITEKISSIAKLYNYESIETPIFEHIEVFSRTVGQTSDIVTKEMYAFMDKKARQLVLRPEGTAPVMRAIVENRLFSKLPLKLAYYGPMFRYENPQKNRQRQFTQFGVEFLGLKNPLVDLEVICFAFEVLKSIGLDFVLKVNSLGDEATKLNYAAALKNYFLPFKDQLSSQSLTRLDKNPLRILDDKIEQTKDFVKAAPQICDYYSPSSKLYWTEFLQTLDQVDLPYEVDHRLVRGLDYYSEVTFEFVSASSLSESQGTLLGGGRYDNLLSEFGGPKLSGIGWALGIERLTNDLLMQIAKHETFLQSSSLDVYVINLTKDKDLQIFAIVQALRAKHLKVEWDYQPIKLAKGFDRATKLLPLITMLIGEQEIETGIYTIKFQQQTYKFPKDSFVNDIIKLLTPKEQN